jgi:protein-tyrosine sulfotransferase
MQTLTSTESVHTERHSKSKLLRTAFPRALRSPWWLARRLGLSRFDAWRSAPYVSEDSPIVVGGSGRSGTTLLRVILDSHPAICCGPETQIFLPHPPNLRRLSECYDLPLSELKRIKRYAGSQAEFIDHVSRAYRERTGRARWAEKHRSNIGVVDFIFSHFPKTRFIHMIRDGRDVVCSLQRHLKLVGGDVVPIKKPQSFDQAVDRWEDAILTGLRLRSDPRYTELKYEDLIGDPEASLRRIFEFIGEDYDPCVLEFHRQKSPSRDLRRFPHNPRAVEPLSNGSIQRWRAELTLEQRIALLDRVGPLLSELGYASDDSWATD